MSVGAYRVLKEGPRSSGAGNSGGYACLTWVLEHKLRSSLREMKKLLSAEPSRQASPPLLIFGDKFLLLD